MTVELDKLDKLIIDTDQKVQKVKELTDQIRKLEDVIRPYEREKTRLRAEAEELQTEINFRQGVFSEIRDLLKSAK
jgi:SMC interacting uncharacterized protein involved in chromosome segregation